MVLEGPVKNIVTDCERVLETLPAWFGIPEALRAYAWNTIELPTFVAREDGRIIAFLSLRQHFQASWEVNCIAVEAASRNAGVGRLLHAHVEAWLLGSQKAVLLQVKTLAESHPSPAYAETRRFYERIGYAPLEVFPTLWAPHLPVLQLIKVVQNAG